MKSIGVVLAGGMGRRMGGADKPLRLLGDRRLIDHVIDRFAPQCSLLLINSNASEPIYADYPFPVIADTLTGFAGPLAGIVAALDWVADHHPDCTTLASVASDSPFLPLDLVARLEQARHDEGQPLACAQSNGQLHPPFALWPLALRDEIKSAVLTEQWRKLDTLLKRFGCAYAEWNEEPSDPFFNVNTPEDLERAHHLLAKHDGLSATGHSVSHRLDLSGLKCPLPALKTARMLSALASGAELEILCTDPMAQIDIPHLVQTEGHHLLDQSTQAQKLRFLIRKA